MWKNEYITGVKSGVSIGLGYFSVSFSFGILAVKGGLSVFITTLISMTNLTSAGQFAGLNCILAMSGLVALALTQLVINLRYALMSLSLSQKLKANTGTVKRMIIAFFNTDEIFAVAMGHNKPVGLAYMLGLASLPWIGWTAGPVCGATAGAILPISVTSALGLALYAMFIAIVVPAVKSLKSVSIVVVLAALFSCLMEFIPALGSFSIIISTVLSAAIVAKLFPVSEK